MSSSTPPSHPNASHHPIAPAPALFQELARDDVFRLETSRLWLRWPKLAGANAMMRLASMRAVAEMTANIPHPYPKDSAETAIFNARKGNALGDVLALAITRKDKPEELIGMISASPNRASPNRASPNTASPNTASIVENGVPGFGYWLGLDHWGKGYATEAAQAMIDAVFTMTGAVAIEADARVTNPASRQVLEKCGFRHEGSRLKAMPARGGLYPCDMFRLERKTWASLRNWAALKSWAIPNRLGEGADLVETDLTCC